MDALKCMWCGQSVQPVYYDSRRTLWYEYENVADCPQSSSCMHDVDYSCD